MKRGGIHSSKNAYIHLDLRTDAVFMVRTPAISDLETLKAMNHIYGDFPRNSYRSDNAKTTDERGHSCWINVREIIAGHQSDQCTGRDNEQDGYLRD